MVQDLGLRVEDFGLKVEDPPETPPDGTHTQISASFHARSFRGGLVFKDSRRARI